ncbi:MAG: MliC family protein [Moraxellaceae bacterium]
MQQIRLMCAACVLAVMLTACDQPEATPEPAAAPNPAVPATDVVVSGVVEPEAPVSVTAGQSSTVHYSCTPDQQILATYDNRDATKPKAILNINGVDYKLYSVVSASGARYATEQGIQPEQGMQWHTKADKAVLTSMTLDHTAQQEDEKTLFDCTEHTAH